jgi:LasA protease
LPFSDHTSLRLSPELNAGTVAIQYWFASFNDLPRWAGILYSPDGFPALHEKMFDNPWKRAQQAEPLFAANLSQPAMALPFRAGEQWSFSGGPHAAWGAAGARAALDFAPSLADHGCSKALNWVEASAPGLVVRSEHNVVVLDLDGDGYEQTGWDILYMHIAEEGHIAVGTRVAAGDPIGHPSCEGGLATGTHVHIARKFNGEWVLADGPVPFILSGWQGHAGAKPYEGWLTRDGQTVVANPLGILKSIIVRENTGP